MTDDEAMAEAQRMLADPAYQASLERRRTAAAFAAQAHRRWAIGYFVVAGGVGIASIVVWSYGSVLVALAAAGIAAFGWRHLDRANRAESRLH